MFDELTGQIDELLTRKSHVIVGISGFGGSGKTTLADRLRDYYKIKDAQTVRLDNLFAEDHEGKPIFQDYDWPVILDILKNSQNGTDLHYQGRGFYGEPMPFDEPLPKVLIVEGVRLFSSESISFFDVAVWIDCPLDFATKRGEDRDRERGADKEHISRWKNEWEPKDKVYFDDYHPEELATFLYKDYK